EAHNDLCQRTHVLRRRQPHHGAAGFPDRACRCAVSRCDAEDSRRGAGAEGVAQMEALGDQLISGPKGYMALGAFNRDERSKALDMLGFHRQLVFATFSELTAFSPELSIEHRYAAARAHNRAMAEFCGKDQ